MVGPIDYTMQVLDPIQGYLQGLQFGENVQTARLGREQTRQAMGIQAAQEARAAEEFQIRKAEAARKVEEAQRGQQVLADLFSNPNPTSDDFMGAYVANPAIREEIKFLMTNQTSEQNRALLTSAQNIYAAAAQQNPDVLRRILTEQRDAMSASGNEQMVRLVDEGLKMLDTDPAGAMQQLRATTGLTILGLGGDISKINEALGLPEAPKPTEAFLTLDAQLRAGGIVPVSEGGDGRYEQAMQAAGGAIPKAPEAASPIGKIMQDVKAGILPQSVLDTAIRIEEKRASSDEGLTLQQKIAEEARLRGEYTKRTEDLVSAERNYEIIQTSAADNSGAGDIALVTSFMKMLDPGSVVRETEFATAANAGGLLARLRTIATKIEDGQFLSEQQRTDFQRLAEKYLQAARDQEGPVRESYQAIIDNYGLNPVNVFGTRAVTTTPPSTTTPPPTTPSVKIVGGPDVTLDFSSMTIEDILKVDIMSLTREQALAMDARLKELE